MKLFFIFLLGIYNPFVFAFIPSPFNLSYNKSGTASLEQDFSYLLNPSTLSFQPKSQSALAYSIKGPHQMVAVSFTDSKTNLPLGITYEKYWSTEEEKIQFNRAIITLTKPFNKYFSTGVNIYRETTEDKSQPTLWRGDLGFLLRFSRSTALSITVNELFAYNQNPKRVFTLGLYRKFVQILSTRLDLSYSQQKEWIARGAFETIFKKYLSLKLGGGWSLQEKKGTWSGGLVFYGPFLQLDYSLEKNEDTFQHALIGKLLF